MRYRMEMLQLYLCQFVQRSDDYQYRIHGCSAVYSCITCNNVTFDHHKIGLLITKEFFSKIRDNFGIGWVGPGLTRILVWKKSSQNSLILVGPLIFGEYTMWILFVYVIKSC